MIDVIRILGVDYKIIVTDSVDKLAGDTFGCMDGMKCTICIKESAEPLSIRIGTLIHELVEAIDSRLELELRHPQISSLDAAFTQILLDNPDLLKEILKATKR